MSHDGPGALEQEPLERLRADQYVQQIFEYLDPTQQKQASRSKRRP
jgi:hypothetical protein